MWQKVTYGNISGLGYVTSNISQDQQDHLGMPLVPFGTPLDICLWHSGPRAEAWRGPWAAHLQQRRTCSPGSKAGLRSTLLWGSTARNAYTFGKERVGEGGRGRVGARCVSQAAERVLSAATAWPPQPDRRSRSRTASLGSDRHRF